MQEQEQELESFLKGGSCQAYVRLSLLCLCFYYCCLVNNVSFQTISIEWTFLLRLAVAVFVGQKFCRFGLDFGIVARDDFLHVRGRSITHFYCVSVQNFVEWVGFVKMLIQCFEELVGYTLRNIH